MSEIDLNVGEQVPEWSSTKEFAGGRKIAIVGFQRLSKERGETESKYVDKEGMTYRLTFKDIETGGKERFLEVHSRGFKNDLASSAKKVFGSDSIPEGAVIVLSVTKVDKQTQSGVTQVNQWSFEKAEDSKGDDDVDEFFGSDATV